MRNQVVELESVNGSLPVKYSKEPKADITSAKPREARRKYGAMFTCPFEGCNDDFTRKHNLDSECSICFDITSL